MDLSLVTLTQLRYVVALDRFRSFRLAAESCHVSQPALSMQVSKLEELLGVTLFDRSKQPVMPTDRGELVVEQARTILRETERLADAARSESDVRGRFRLGVIPSLAPTLLPLFLPEFSARHPRVELVVEEVQTDPMLERLEGDSLDGGIAVTPLGVPALLEHALFQEAFFVYAPPGHPLTKRARVRQSDLGDEKLWLMSEGHCFRAQVLSLCRAHRPAGDDGVRFESGSFETLTRLVDAGLGITILPELVVESLPAKRRKSQVRPFAAPVPVRQVSFIRMRQHLHRSIAEALAETLRATTRSVDASSRRGSVVSPVADQG